MPRPYSPTLRRQTLAQILFDTILLLGVLSVVLLVSRDAVLPMPIAASCGLLLAAGLLVINTVSGLYRYTSDRRLGETCVRATFALALALPLAYYVFTGFSTAGHQSHGGVPWAAMLCVASIVTNRVHAAHARKSRRPYSRILIFGTGAEAQAVGRTLQTTNPRAQIVGYFQGPNEVNSVVDQGQIVGTNQSLHTCAIDLRTDEIIIALTERRGGSMPLRDLLDCKIGGVRVLDLSTYFERVLGLIRINHVHAGWLIFGNGFHQGMRRTLMKRTVDLIGSILLLIAASPLLLATAIAIRLEGPGPIFYRQERVGLGGQKFYVLKFRSMRPDAEKDGKPRWASTHDDRVTRVGAVIRRYRIDELPQLLNVMRGTMSLVGPRPERPYFVEELTKRVPFYAVRHSVKPGVTGWAQVRFQYGATVEDAIEKLEYDLYYVKNHRLLLDLLVLFETIRVVLSGDGAR